MDTLLNFGIQVILVLQTQTWLEAPMQFFSFLGSEQFFILAMPTVYWCVDAALGLRMGLLLLVNNSINDAFKVAFHGPRPYWFDSRVHAFSAETSFGVPSGHAQISTGVWGAVATFYQRKWLWGVALAVIFFIGLSRLFLGVHFLHDVLLGWLLGAFILWAFFRFWDSLAAWARSQTVTRQVFLAFALSLAMLAFSVAPRLILSGWQLPAAWVENVRAAGVGEFPEPFGLSGAITTAATLFGLLTGLALLSPYGRFTAEGTLTQRALRYLVGLAGIAILYVGLGMLFSSVQGELLAYVLRYIRYALIGMWVSAGAPWLFWRLKLAEVGKSSLRKGRV